MLERPRYRERFSARVYVGVYVYVNVCIYVNVYNNARVYVCASTLQANKAAPRQRDCK